MLINGMYRNKIYDCKTTPESPIAQDTTDQTQIEGKPCFVTLPRWEQPHRQPCQGQAGPAAVPGKPFVGTPDEKSGG